MTKKYLLILPCSKRKRELDNSPALDLYDGPFFRVLRKYNLQNIDVLIISAKYGLICSDEIISNYDQKMTSIRAKEISEEIKNKLEKIMKINKYNDIFINLGKIYIVALDESRSMLEGDSTHWASGRIGERIHQLSVWLQHTLIEDVD